MLTPDEQAEFDALNIKLGYSQPPQQQPQHPDTGGIFSRIGQQAANFLPNIGEGLTNSLIGTVNLGQPSGNQIPAAQFPKFYDLPPAQGFGQKAVDIGAGLGQVVAEAAIPGGVGTRAGRLLGLGRYAPILGDAIAGGLQGIKQSNGEALGTGAEFGALGAANLIPNRGIRLLANAAVPVAGQLLRGQNPLDQQSLINTGANIAVPALLGQYGRRLDRPAQADEAPPTAQPRQLLALNAPPQAGEMRGDAVYGGYTEPGQREGMSPDRGFTMDYTPPQSRGRSLLGLPPPRTIGEAARSGDIVQFNGDWGVVGEGEDGYYLHGDNGTQRIFGKVPDMPLHQIEGLQPQVVGDRSPEPEPPFQRDQTMPRASLLSPREEQPRSAFLTPASQYVAGATGGALAGPLIDQEDDKPVWEKMLEGAAIGAGAVGLGRGAGAILLHRAPEPIPTTIEELSSMRQDRFKGATIRVLDNESQLPDDWRAKIQPALDAGTRHEGLVNPATGETYIFKDNLSDPTRASQVIAHEVAGHYGVEQLLSRSDWRSAQESVLNGDSQRAKDISQAYFGTDDLSSLNPRQRETVTKEYIARLSENTPLNPNLWERLKDGVNRATRALGAKRDWSDSEFQGLIRRGAKEAETPLMQPSGVRPDIFPSSGPEASIVDTSKSLLPTRKAGDEQERNPTIGGYINRAVRREFGTDRTAETFRAEELAKGIKNENLEKAKPILKTLGTATAPERKALLDYQESPHTASDVALLRTAVRPEIAGATQQAEDQFGSIQSLLGHATDDPEKQRLLSDTYGTYRTQKYDLFNDPKKWLREDAANPGREDALVAQIIKDNEMPGMNEESIRAQLRQYIEEQMRPEGNFQSGAGSSKISKDLWLHRKTLSPEFKDWIGEIKDPVQRIAATFQKLINSSAQAKKIVELSEAGKRGEIDVKTWGERQSEVTAALVAGDAKRADALRALKQVPNNPAFGTLAGKLVPQDVIDSLNAHNQLWGGGVLRTLAPLNHLIKTSLTVNNPGTHARQWIQTPIFAAVARVNPFTDFHPAVRAIRAKGAEWEELLRNHIVGADFSSSELARVGKDLDLAYNPGNGGNVMEALRKTQAAIQKAYGLPDNLVRAAAYLKQKPRFFAEGNKMGLKGADLERYAQTKAADFTNRYTMNYGAVPNITKVGRETPFVSPFLSYQSDMVRILKNLGEDAIKGSPVDRTWALGNLASLTALPLIAMQAAKAQLSDKDREDWDRANRLSPAYSGGQLRIPLGRNKDGSFRYVNVANLMPAGDTSAMLRNLAGGDGAKLFASNPFIGWEKTPILNLAAEQISGRDSVTEQLLTPVGRVKEVAKAFLPPLTPGIGYEADRAISSFTQNNEGGRGLMNPRTGRMDTPGTFLLRNVVGVPVSQVQPRALLQRAKSDEQEVERGIKSEMNQTTGTNASPEAKQKAREVALLKIGNARGKYNATKYGTTIQIAKSKIAKAQSLGWSVEQ